MSSTERKKLFVHKAELSFRLPSKHTTTNKYWPWQNHLTPGHSQTKAVSRLVFGINTGGHRYNQSRKNYRRDPIRDTKKTTLSFEFREHFEIKTDEQVQIAAYSN